MKNYWVYIISNKTRTVLYTGITNDIERKVLEHKANIGSKFSSQFNCTELLYSEEHQNVNDAISREKQIKKWKRSWKEKLIQETNPNYADLACEWFAPQTILMMKSLLKIKK